VNKKRWTALLATLFLVQAIALAQVSFTENSCILNVPARLPVLSFSSDITIQVLPGVNSILRDCKIRPHTYSFYPASRALESSP